MGGKHDWRVPNHRDHSFMPLCLSIVNQFNDVHESKFEIPVERIPTQIRPRAERRCILYDGADGSPGHPGSPVDAPHAVLCAPDCRRSGRWTSPRIAGRKPRYLARKLPQRGRLVETDCQYRGPTSTMAHAERDGREPVGPSQKSGGRAMRGKRSFMRRIRAGH